MIYTGDDYNPPIHSFQGKEDVPRLTLLGGVHGNEPCGPEALQRLLAMIEGGSVVLRRGGLTVIPVANPLARAKNVRFVERNLNRFLYPKEMPQAYEDHLDNVLCPILERSDYLLDLHSYRSRGEAFVFLGKIDEDNLRFARCLGVGGLIYGWADAMAASDDVADKREAMGTTEYARQFGAVSVTLECGTHDHPRAADVGLNAALKALAYLDMVDIDERAWIKDLPELPRQEVKMAGVVIKTKPGDFVQDWDNLERLKAGTVIARLENGEEVKMPEDGVIVLPHRETPMGQAWFFRGREEAL